MALELFKFFYILESEKDNPGRAFPVEIAKTLTVFDLKKAIIAEDPGLAGYNARSIMLNRIDILSDGDYKKNIKSAVQTELGNAQEMISIFPNGPARNTVHIMVRTPSEPGTPPRHPASRPPEYNIPEATDDYIKGRITDFQPGLEIAINAFFEDNTELPLWEPEVCSDPMRIHITSLKIPKISPSSRTPSLLLHDLGQLPHNKQVVKRVELLFDPGYGQRFFCNTSGSGKTRLLLEGLSLNWGLYFTSRTQPEGVGSSDLERVLESLEAQSRLTTLTEENRDEAHATNRAVTYRRFLLLIYVRLLIFHVFLKCASALPGGIVDDHKRRWLLVQLAPATLLGSDVFHKLTNILMRASAIYLDEGVSSELSEVAKLLAIQPSELFCVLDEAQIPANMFFNCFLSETEPVKPRPILRQLLASWTQVLPKVIISGTGISMDDMETVIGSVVAKLPSFPSITINDTGAFNGARTQRAYLKRYLPKGYLHTEEGKSVASRVRYWLHGRHRFTAAYTSLLLLAGLTTPHTVLNTYVYLMTNFRPSDHPDDGDLSIELESPKTFDFSRLAKDQPLLRQIAGCIFEYIFNGTPRNLGGPADMKLVEYGVARFVVNRNIKADEPLALLAATHYFNTETDWPWQHFLVDGLSTSNESVRGIAFEQVGAYLLGLAFSSPMPLSEVFDFVGYSGLKHEKAQLVAIHKVGEGYIHNLANILSAETIGSYILGYSPRTTEDTLAWIKDPEKTVFCFPAKAVGPDLILFLRLPDESLLRVIVQFKTEKRMGPSKTEDALRTTDPRQFTSRRSSTQDTKPPQAQKGKRKSTNIVNPIVSQDFQDALGVLGSGNEHAGKLSVLRVLASHPAIPDPDTLQDVADADPNYHPVATVDLPSLARRYSEKKILQSLERIMTTSTSNGQQSNRNPGGEDEDPSSLDEVEDPHVDKKRRVKEDT